MWPAELTSCMNVCTHNWEFFLSLLIQKNLVLKKDTEKNTTYSCKYYWKKSNVKLDIMWCSRRRNVNNHGKAWHLYLLWAISEIYKISKPIRINWLLVLKLHHYSYKKFKHRFTIISGHLPIWQISWFTWQNFKHYMLVLN